MRVFEVAQISLGGTYLAQNPHPQPFSPRKNHSGRREKIDLCNNACGRREKNILLIFPSPTCWRREKKHSSYLPLSHLLEKGEKHPYYLPLPHLLEKGEKTFFLSSPLPLVGEGLGVRAIFTKKPSYSASPSASYLSMTAHLPVAWPTATTAHHHLSNQ